MGLIAVLCAGLSIFSTEWTGEFSRAERARLSSGLNEQAGRLARAFDDELNQSFRALVPDRTEIRAEGMLEAHRSRYEQWASAHDASLFSRVAVVVPEQGRLTLHAIHSAGRMVSMEWPPSWQPLREAMIARMHLCSTGLDAH